MHTIGIGLGICPAREIVLQEGKTSPLGVVPIRLDMGCRSVVNCIQFARGGGLAIPLLVIERRT